MRLLESTSCLIALALALAASGCSSSSSSPSTPVVTPGDDAGGDVASGDDSAVTPAAYPAGPYGLLAHNIVPNVTWKGYRDATGEVVDMSMADYYDPDGKKGITGIYFIIAAEWCPPCNAEAEVSPKIYAEAYKARGGKYVSVITEDKNHKPSTLATADAWIKAHKINFDMGYGASNDVLPNLPDVGLPHNYIIDPRTMAIQSITEGVDTAVWACDMYPKGDSTLGADGCCVAGKTLYTDGSNVCTQDYFCSKGLVCIPPGSTTPSRPLEVVMTRNGAKPFGS
jgi:hypothetical protein